MKVTIVGGGNIGTQFAVHMAEKKHSVKIFTSSPDCFDDELIIVDENGLITHRGVIDCATNDPEEAFGSADLIMLTIPASVMDSFADIIFRHTDEKTVIGVVPGTGGSECAFRKCIERGNVFFGIERVPAIARLVEKGKCVRSVGYRGELKVAAFPHSYTDQCASMIEDIFDIPCTTINNYLSLTLTPSNPILHTTRLKTLFADWHEGLTYEHVPLFYEDWDDSSSQLLLKCDDELQLVCEKLKEFIPEIKVKSLKDHYESYTVSDMTKKIVSIKAFKGLKSPVLEKEDGWVLDFGSRYFTSDFPFGLTIIEQISEMLKADVPNIHETMEWYRSISPCDREFRYSDYDINDLTELVDFYLK